MSWSTFLGDHTLGVGIAVIIIFLLWVIFIREDKPGEEVE